jgi:ribonucleoside-diphosphate reductase subunit M1
LISCFLVANKSDSLDDLTRTIKTCAKISKSAGGIGVHVHNVSAAGTIWTKYPKHKSHGLVERLKCFNDLAQYVDQGGRVSIYLSLNQHLVL